MRVRSILLAALMILVTFSPLVAAGLDEKTQQSESISFIDHQIENLNDLMPRISTATGGRAACSTVQTDGGSAGDAGNTSTTAKDLGTDPNNGPTGVTGCVDANDKEDMYKVTTTAGKDVDVELVVPANMDFDLYLVDSTKTTFYSWSEYNDPLEKVSTGGTNLSGVATSFYIWINAYTGDGQYTLRVWTNNTPPRPDMTISGVEVPAKAQAGDTVDVNYTVENLGNASTGAFEVHFAISTDQILGFGDTVLDHVENEADLASNGSRYTQTQITIPANTTNGSYYWLVIADGYDNITEQNDSNNEGWSAIQTTLGKDCLDLIGGPQNDAGLGADAPNEAVNASDMGSNVTATYTGCIDGADPFDYFNFDVPSGYYFEVSLTGEDASSDIDLYIHDSNGSQVDLGFTSSYPETVSTKLTNWEGVGDTYTLNVSHYSGVTNYTLDVWTNQSIPAPDYHFDEVTSGTSSNAGDGFNVDVVLNNSGTVDGNSTVELKSFLSVNFGLDWYDHEIGSTTVNGIPMGTTTSVTIPSTIPIDIVPGSYNLYVVVDQDKLVVERDDDNNEMRRNGIITIDTAETSCSTQDDAGMGSDAGSSAGNEMDLGQYTDAEYRGCIDNNDLADYYKFTVASGETIDLVLVDPPEGAVNLALFASDGTEVASDPGLFADSELSSADTPYDGVAGTYTVMVNRSTTFWEDGGNGTYRLLLGSPEGYVTPFSCSGYSDTGTGTDAGTGFSNPMIIGTNPVVEGQACLGGTDEVDAFQFSLDSGNNLNVNLSMETTSGFTSELFDIDGNLISDWDGSSWTTLNNEMYEGQDGTFVLVVNSEGDEGYYNLSIATNPPAPADLAVSNVSCGADMVSNEELYYSFDIHNLRGPVLGDFSWTIELLDSEGQHIVDIDSATQNTYAIYGQLILGRSSSIYLDSETLTGVYSCQVMVNMDAMVFEENMTNNIAMGENFTIQNEAELWANDIDRDGYNTTDVGDGIIDDCPESWGESWGDRSGCADLDGDGWSNLNDFAPLDESQWEDVDEDGFGDNSTGFEGDQCPGVYGITGGEGGDGCPEAFVDTDGDGIADSADQCDDTPSGVAVDADGCEVDTDGDGVADSQDNCPATPTGESVDLFGCKIDDGSTGSDGGGDGSGNGGDGNGDDSGDGNGDGDVNDDTQSGDNFIEDNMMMIAAAVGGIILLLIITMLFVRGGGDDSKDDMFANAAFNDPMMSMGGVDPTITAEQLSYEQQLAAAGYNPQQARQYADQHFRPWLNQ